MRRWKPLAVAGVVVAGVAVLVTSSLAATSAQAQRQVRDTRLVAQRQPGRRTGALEQVAKEYHAAHPDVTIKAVAVRERACCSRRRSRSRSRRTTRPTSSRNWGGGALVDEVKAKQGRGHHQVRRAVDQDHRRVGRRLAGQRPAVRGPLQRRRGGVLVQQEPIRAGRDHLDTDDLAAVPGRGQQAEGGGHHSDLRSEARTAGRTPSTGTISPRSSAARRRCSSRRSPYNFKDPCWLKAGVYVQQLLDAKPFQDGFLATPAQQVARARRACSRTARSRWSCRATGTRA